MKRIGGAALVLVGLVIALASASSALAGDAPNLLDPPDPGLATPGPVVLENPDIHNIYLDGSWDDENPSFSMASIDAFTQSLVDSNYLNAAGQYGVGPASVSGPDEKGGGDLCGALPFVGVADIAAISFWLGCELGPTIVPSDFTIGGFDPPDDNSLYVLYVPTGTSWDVHASCGSQGIHLWGTTPVWTTEPIPFPPFVAPVLKLQTYAFAVVFADCAASKANPLDVLGTYASHEIIEAATDRIPIPEPLGWIDRSLDPVSQLSNGEAADICQNNSGSLMPTKPVRLTNGILVSPYWSNADAAAGRPGCQPVTHTVKLDEKGLPATVAHQAVFDGSTVSLPFSTIVDDGTTHSWSFPSPVSDPNPGTRYVTDEPAVSLVVTANITKIAQYTTEHFLTVNATPSAAAALDTSLTPSAWEKEGAVVPITTDALITVGPDSRYRFDHWSGDAAGTSPNTTVTMDGPKTATANYVLQHLVTVHTDGLGLNNTHVFNGGTLIGTANDFDPLAVFLDDGPLALSADTNVNGADGTQYFFQGFDPPAPTTLVAAFTTTAKYETIAQLIADALASGGIYGPGADGLANSYDQQFAAVEKDMGAGNYAGALLELKSFINHLQAQAEKHLTSAFDDTLQLDALLVFHNALCLAISAGQINAQTAANDYTYYSDLVSTLGGTVLPPC
jgi:hypothetical protein